jgi:hypothetical protein
MTYSFPPTNINATGDYKVSGAGIVHDTGSAATKVSYLNIKINRGGTIISRSAFSVITKGANVNYYIFVPEQIVSLLVGDKLFLEFEANSNVSGTIHRLSTNVNRLLYGVG